MVEKLIRQRTVPCLNVPCLKDSGIIGQQRTVYAPAGGSIEEFCNIHPLIKFVAV